MAALTPRRTLALVLLGPAAFVACAGAPAPSGRSLRVAEGSARSERAPAQFANVMDAVGKIDPRFADLAKKEALPGLAVGLVAGGALAWSQGYGVRDVTTHAPVDADTVFRIGSITKTFTAVAALLLRDAGRLWLDEPASRWIPELDDVVYPTGDSPRITLRSLLTHSSGLPVVGKFSYTDPSHTPSEAEITASLRGLSLSYTPETRSEYSNLGVGIAGIVVGRAAGVSYRDFVTANLLRPLEMASSAWERESVPADRLATAYGRAPRGGLEPKEHWRLGALEGAGGLYSTVRDLSRWAAMHLRAYPPRNEADPGPVRRATLREAMTIHHAHSLGERTMGAASASGIGFAWHVFEDCGVGRVVWHAGGTEGYSSIVAMLPERGIALVALTNLFDAGDGLTKTTLDALHELAGAVSLPKAVASPAMLEARELLLRLFAQWDDATAHALFTDAFLKSLGGLAKLHEVRDGMVAELGPCKPSGDVEARGELQAHWALQCERESTECDAWLESPASAKVTGLRCAPPKKDRDERALRCR